MLSIQALAFMPVCTKHDVPSTMTHHFIAELKWSLGLREAEGPMESRFKHGVRSHKAQTE